MSEPVTSKVNTVLLALLLALTAWTLKTVQELTVAMAVMTQRVSQHDYEFANTRQTLDQQEKILNDLRGRSDLQVNSLNELWRRYPIQQKAASQSAQRPTPTP